MRVPFGSFRQLYPDGEVFVNWILQQSDHFLVRLFDYVNRDGVMLHAVRGYRQVKWPSLVESPHEYIQTTPLPARHHQLCCLALLPIQLEPP
jgi:hypothetical protein